MTHRAGFTFIELMVVTSITAVLILSATGVLFNILLSQGRTNTTAQVKNYGDYALGQMSYLLRNAVDLLPNSSNQRCAANMSEIKFRGNDDGITTLLAESDSGVWKIASNSGVFLTSSGVELVDLGGGQYVQFNCTQSADRLIRSVEIVFTLGKGTAGVDRESEVITQQFRTTVTLRGL